MTRQRQRLRALLWLMFVATAAVGYGAAEEVLEERLDQSQTGRVTTFHIPSDGVWQSFTPAFTGNLTRIEVLLGQGSPEEECQMYEGDLMIHTGRGSEKSPFFTSTTQLHKQHVVASECRCTSKDCVVWQSFQLTTPVPVESNQLYSFLLSAPRRKATTFRIGLAVTDLYARGANHFAAPGYDFTFKTYMSVAAAPVPLDEQTTIPAETGPTTAAEVETARSEVTALNVSLIVGGLAAVCMVVIIALVVRRYRRREGRVLASSTDLDAVSGTWRMAFADALEKPRMAWHELPYAQQRQTTLDE
eukprot:m.10295 g.10295  ORF g.10295 m.10295 type:complete len:303 (-) comp5974_c0_seq1:301-1209(-)